jgi:hypothetical protein
MPVPRRLARLAFGSLALVLLLAGLSPGASYHVATTGDDGAGDGSAAKPWATINHALAAVPAAGGDTILVAPGTYNGRAVTYRSFASPLTIQSETAYRAKLTCILGGQADEIISIFTAGDANIVIDGFDVSNVVPGFVADVRNNVLIHFQDASRIELRNCVIHGNTAPGGCNELLKINRGSDSAYPRNIFIHGNVFYDRPSIGGADMIDSVRPGELDIYENIFFERGLSDHSQSFITLKRQVNAIPPAALPVRSPRDRVSSNVFLSWDGSTDQAFVQFGEDTDAEVMISDSVIENNLMIGDSANPIVAPVQLKGCVGITVRANTVVGDLPSSSFGARIGTEGSNPPSHGFLFANNIWCDPTGTMTNRLMSVYGSVDIATILLDHDLFWNQGNALPATGEVLPTADAHRVVADPKLPTNQAGIVLPVLDEGSGTFPSGSATIRQEFERLVNAYGAIPSTSAARDAANAAAMPALDILGRARDAHPDIGCFEYGAATTTGGGTTGATTVGGAASGGGTGATGGAVGGGNGTGGGHAGCGLGSVLGVLAAVALSRMRRRS